jgi:Flp pilus assembly protein TadG
MRRLLIRVWRNEAGQALAEFALVLPVLLLLIAGIIEFGRAFHIQQIVTDAAREGARAAVVQDGAVDYDSAMAVMANRLLSNGIDTAGATLDIQPMAEFRNTGTLMTARVVVPYTMGFVGAVASFFGGGGDIQIGSHTVMRNE